MTSTLKISLKDLTHQMLLELQEQFGQSAELEIKVKNNKTGKPVFNDTDFWLIISQLDWSKNDSDDVINPAVQALSKMPIVNIYLFSDILTEKLFQLDTKAHAQVFLKSSDDYLSVDDFLYARCAVVAEGKTYYENVLKNPTEMPVDLTFEPLLSIDGKAYQLNTGKEFLYLRNQAYETYSNKEGWK